MLFPYTYVPHDMEKMQTYVDFIFFEVWSKAKGNTYSIDTLFTENQELYEIVTELHFSAVKGAEFFLTGLQQIFEDFKLVSDADIAKLSHWYESNNNIGLLCANDASATPATYSDIESISEDLSRHLGQFFKNLYAQDFLSLKSITNRIGVIDDHYKTFVTINSSGKCPFCGISDIKGIDHSTREAYDHFLPKGIYPFNSINFRNLAPACNNCNSSYKLTKNPLYQFKNPLKKQSGVRRKSFYPYQANDYSLNIEIAICCQDWTSIKPGDIVIKVGPDEFTEEINTWLDVYGIEERYKAMCCTENAGKYWIEQVLDECQNDGSNPEMIFITLVRQAKLKPFAEVNFLKLPFLEACNQAGLFNAI
ncbi:hypothetical protein MGMO_93c00230 [Methyloglobulus morosus KoM1]|uniref:HNH endonuclease n=1 Tax=Methyloglobulus morosus KoM1 TaxID=1116472 RepID=V5BEG7_9GAMM|nr:hypothetical protein [Methyloglobulus morosus]ESS71665.1 hypothetical protein MGMO_93c00230 [Methyloglobulus morosus KoM1]